MTGKASHDIGWIGLGRMGEAMAARLVKAGHGISVWNRKRETGMQGVSREEAIGRTIFEILHRQPATMLRREFDEVFGRIREQKLTYWADPGHRQRGEINTNDGGRGVYFDSPDGHVLEILTRPYGSGG